ncbi:MAG TPA: response regulator [Veillonellaceae bacterium]|nr:response regulator [Veillonellaceae bacterium]
MKETYQIVIADDEALIVMDLKEMLEEEGHHVAAVAKDGVEALEAVKKYHPDLVIMDVKMPRLDGIQAARMISHDNLAPVVLLTAFGDEEIIEKAKQSLVFGYVMKPVEEKTLFPAIQIAVSQFRQKAEMIGHVQNVEKELAERKMVERAKGLLMDYYHIGDDEAYRKMQHVSMKNGIPLAVVAQKVIKEILARKNK